MSARVTFPTPAVEDPQPVSFLETRPALDTGRRSPEPLSRRTPPLRFSSVGRDFNSVAPEVAITAAIGLLFFATALRRFRKMIAIVQLRGV